MDTKQINDAKDKLTKIYLEHYCNATSSTWTDREILELMFQAFIEGRKESLKEIQTQCDKYSKQRYLSYADLTDLSLDEAIQEETTMTIKESLDLTVVRSNQLRSHIDVLLRKLDMQAEERKVKIPLSLPVEKLELTVKSFCRLKENNIKTLGDITNLTERNILMWKNSGRKTLQEIKMIVEACGYKLKEEATGKQA